MNLYWGDNLEHLQFEDDNSVDAVVTDPPYGIAFMGKKWDYDVPSIDLWREVLRVLKPGGHLLSFGGTRTYHRMVVNIEDAGFEIRDQIMWLYGSGFPKSHNVAKGIDKPLGVVPTKGASKGTMPVQTGDRLCAKDARDEARHYDKFDRVANFEQLPTSDDAKRWQGWVTALKPANEPIVLARKPIEKGLTVAENVLKWGTGAINVDGTRIEAQDQDALEKNWDRSAPAGFRDGEHTLYGKGEIKEGFEAYKSQGRWPANVLFDEDAAELLDAQSGTTKSVTRPPNADTPTGNGNTHGAMKGLATQRGFADAGGASRFFYVAKTSKRERNAGLEGMKLRARPKFDGGDFERGNGNNAKDQKAQNFHPTVKPIKLMEYLIKLITPPNGVVLDPFMGSGSTGCAATNLKFRFIGIELEKEYFEIAKKRIAHNQRGNRK